MICAVDQICPNLFSFSHLNSEPWLWLCELLRFYCVLGNVLATSSLLHATAGFGMNGLMDMNVILMDQKIQMLLLRLTILRIMIRVQADLKPNFLLLSFSWVPFQIWNSLPPKEDALSKASFFACRLDISPVTKLKKPPTVSFVGRQQKGPLTS